MANRGGPARRRARMLAAVTAAGMVAVTLAACSSSGSSSAGPGTSGTSSTSGGSGTSASSQYAPTPVTLTAAQETAIIGKAFLTTSVSPSSLNPDILQGLEEAGGSYTAAQVKTAWSCQSQTTCTIGSGSQTLAILDGDGGNLWRQITRAAITMEAFAYPNIGHVIYLQAGGDLQTMQADLKSLIARRVTGIVTYDDFGAAMTAAYQQATAQGIPVVAYGGTPGSGAVSAVVSQVQSSFCADGDQMAQTTSQMLGGKGNVAFFTGTPGNPQGAGWRPARSPGSPRTRPASRSSTSPTPAGRGQRHRFRHLGADRDRQDGQRDPLRLREPDRQHRADLPAREIERPDQITWTSDNQLLSCGSRIRPRPTRGSSRTQAASTSRATSPSPR